MNDKQEHNIQLTDHFLFFGHVAGTTQIQKIKNVGNCFSKLKITLLLLFFCSSAIGQNKPIDTETIKARLKPSYIKYSDGTKEIQAKVIYKADKNFIPAENVLLQFVAANDSLEVNLAQISTNQLGVAKFIITNNTQIPINENGTTCYRIILKNNEKFSDTENSIIISEANVFLNVEERNDKQYVSMQITKEERNGEEIIIPNEKVEIAVKRLHSCLTIAAGKTNEQGIFETKLPEDLPTDSLGNLTVIAKISDSKIYGTVEKLIIINCYTTTLVESNFTNTISEIENTPFGIKIFVYIIISLAWLIFGYAVFQIVRIKGVKKP